MSHIVLGVSGSIASYKAASLASSLMKHGHEVRAVLTAGASRFVAPLTFEALTGNPVPTTVWDEAPGSSRMGHIELARWADILVVAPASAGALARLALGLPDDMLGAVALSFHGPILIAPAMESAMYRHPATAAHLERLKARGATVVGPVTGRLASGAVGEGRMAEPEDVEAAIESLLRPKDLAGKRVLISAGPTYEPIDPVRFIGNRSSGKMGYEIASAAARRGADVVLVSGPASLSPPAGVEIVPVETSTEMREAVLERAPGQDVIVMAAAVADFRPASYSQSKVKRGEGLTLDLVGTQDIATDVSRAAPHAIRVGFALESEDLVEGARAKLRRKGLDLVVANAISPANNPFGSDSNTVTFVSPDSVEDLDPMPKAEVARLLWDRILGLLHARA